MIRVLLIWIEGRGCVSPGLGGVWVGGHRDFGQHLLRGCWVAILASSISLYVWGRGKGYMCRLGLV